MDGQIATLRQWAKGRAREAASHAPALTAPPITRRINSVAN
jgi:hypothetical protein